LLVFLQCTARRAMKKNVGHKKLREKTPSVTEMIAEIVEQSPKKLPLLRPNWPKSQFDKLCAEHGGPAELGSTVSKSDLQRCCREFPLGQVLPILTRFTKDEISAQRHWPWAAFAVGQYNFEIK
jgi:hypothetical protein